jgi:F420H(2)-dependent quinone reductase
MPPARGLLPRSGDILPHCSQFRNALRPLFNQPTTVYRPLLRYPQGIVQRLLDSLILLDRLGREPLIDRFILILTTTGRVSGKPRMTAVEHRRLGDAYYIVSDWGAKADWYRNI